MQHKRTNAFRPAGSQFSLLLLLLVFTSPAANGQNLFQIKSSRAGSSRLLMKRVVTFPNGLIGITGGGDNTNAIIQLFQADGSSRWTKTFGPTIHTHFDAAVVTPDNRLIAAMNHPSGGAQRGGLYAVDTNGVVLWQKEWSVPNLDYHRLTALEPAAGGYVAWGFARQNNNGQVILLKIDASGNLLWQKTWDVNGSIETGELCTDEAGNLYALAHVYDGGNSATLFKFGPQGQLLWSRHFDVGSIDSGYLLYLAPGLQGDLLLAGSYGKNGASGYQHAAWALNVDQADGATRWFRQFVAPDQDLGFDRVILRQNGNWLASVSFLGPDTSCVYNSRLMELNADGAPLWVKSYSSDELPDLAETSDASLLLLGLFPDGNESAAALMQTDSQGYFPGCCAPEASSFQTVDYAFTSVMGAPYNQPNALQSYSGPVVPPQDYSLNVGPFCIPALDFDLPPEQVCAGSYLSGLFVRQPDFCARYVWEIAGGLPAQSQLLYVDSVQFCQPGMHNITLRINPDKCDLVLTQILEVRDCGPRTANAFTPDGDQLNDRFYPNICSEVEVYEFTVYNRWGQLVFRATQPGEAWDGTIKGQPAPVDVYVWQAIYRTAQNVQMEERGEVTLIR